MFLRGTKAGRRNERGASDHYQGLVRETESMKDRLVRLFTAVGAVAAMAIAGGASLKGF